MASDGDGTGAESGGSDERALVELVTRYQGVTLEGDTARRLAKMYAAADRAFRATRPANFFDSEPADLAARLAEDPPRASPTEPGSG